MEETLLQEPRKRPTLLTVLCILSFVFGAWGVVSSLMSMMNPAGDVEKVQAQMEEAMEGMEGLGADHPMARMMEQGMESAIRAAEQAVPMGIANLILTIAGLLGVWMMWNLRKQGFYIYTLASIAGLAVPFIFLGGGLITLLAVGFGGFIALVFIILYALNLKHMR